MRINGMIRRVRAATLLGKSPRTALTAHVLAGFRTDSKSRKSGLTAMNVAMNPADNAKNLSNSGDEEAMAAGAVNSMANPKGANRTKLRSNMEERAEGARASPSRRVAKEEET